MENITNYTRNRGCLPSISTFKKNLFKKNKYKKKNRFDREKSRAEANLT